jgi:hypothetical protein
MNIETTGARTLFREEDRETGTAGWLILVMSATVEEPWAVLTAAAAAGSL